MTWPPLDSIPVGRDGMAASHGVRASVRRETRSALLCAHQISLSGLDRELSIARLRPECLQTCAPTQIGLLSKPSKNLLFNQRWSLQPSTDETASFKD